MARKRNSNYATVKRDEAKLARESAAKKKKALRILARVGIALAALAVLAGIVLGIAFGLGLFNYYPTATGHVSMAVGDLGSLHIELYGDDAPVTVEHFESLATNNYFKKNLQGFHTYKDGVLYFGSLDAGIRVKPDDLADPDPELELAPGKNDYGIAGEFTDNDFENKITFTRGTIGIMHNDENDSGYGQFFIVLEDKAELNGKYCAFARIFEGSDGLEIVDKLVEDAIAAGAVGDDGVIKIENRVTIGSLSSHDAHDH